MTDFPEDLSKRDAQALIDEKVKAAYALIDEATAIAGHYRLRVVVEVGHETIIYEGDPEDRSMSEPDDGWYNSACW